MSGPCAWILNLDAEHELEARHHTTSPRGRVNADRAVASLRGLVLAGDIVVPFDGGNIPLDARGMPGLAWCPTPRALERLALAGAKVPPVPSVEVLRYVNHRAFCASLGQTLSGARFTRDLSEVDELVRGPTSSGHWLLKRPLSFAGKGRRKVAQGPLSDADRAFVVASLQRHDGLQVEPFVDRVKDIALHGYLAPSGALTLGDITEQDTDDSGAWLRTHLVSGLLPDAAEALYAEAAQVASALFRARYTGPFGIDAYLFRAGNELFFNARGEINARFSMGWAIGMGSRRPHRVL